jgi:hypothetical protein
MPWTLTSVHVNSVETSTSTVNFGNAVKMVLSLRYTPVPGVWEETPRLVWYEKIILIDHQLRQRWEFAGNMYAQKIFSPTLRCWSRRYIHAHEGGPISPVRMLDLQGMPINFHALPGMTDDAKADVVRTYLKTFGGSLLIAITDPPSIGVPPGVQVHKERLLLISCGVTGFAAEAKWAQHLHVNSALPHNQWTRQTWNYWHLQNLPLPTGYVPVLAPTNVSVPTVSLTCAQGEYP